MPIFCSNCGEKIDNAENFCPSCGHRLTIPDPPAAQPPTAPVSPAPAPAVPSAQPEKKKKAKKKHKLPWILRFLLANAIIAGVLFGLWYGFGNMITLYIHSEAVVETLDSGSLDLPGTQNAYSELPNYVKEMLDEKYFETDYGPITKAVLPYIKAERTAIHGFFGASSVEYTITAPDVESWLLNLDPTLVTGEDVLLSMMQEYIQDAPLRSATVEVQYNRRDLFSADWEGNYYTREFADAVCGGFNSAYSVLYEQAMQELTEAMEQ